MLSVFVNLKQMVSYLTYDPTESRALVAVEVILSKSWMTFMLVAIFATLSRPILILHVGNKLPHLFWMHFEFSSNFLIRFVDKNYYCYGSSSYVQNYANPNNVWRKGFGFVFLVQTIAVKMRKERF